MQTIFARRTVSKLADQRLTRAIRTGARSDSRLDLTHPTYARSRKRARAAGNHFPTDHEPAVCNHECSNAIHLYCCETQPALVSARGLEI